MVEASGADSSGAMWNGFSGFNKTKSNAVGWILQWGVKDFPADQ